MKILVTFALDTEFVPWRRLRSFQRSSSVTDGGYQARIGDADVRVVLTGVGEAHARRAVRHALADTPDVFIVSGLAGSLKANLRPGDVVAAAAVREASRTRAVRSEAALVETAAVFGARRVPILVTVDRVARKVEEKKRLSLAGDAVDMESYAAMAEAAARNIPSIAVRALSDAADEDLPLDFNRVLNERGGIQLSRVLGRLVLAPHRFPGLLRLSRNSRHAAEKLGRFLDAYVKHLSNSKRADSAESLAEAVAI
jgi:adenosylhomocysteine nucleosidase